MNDRGQRAGAEARRVGEEFTAPDLDRTIKRRQRARTIGVVASSAMAAVVLSGAGALVLRTESDELPVGTSTSTTVPNETTTTAATSTTEPTTSTTATPGLTTPP